MTNTAVSYSYRDAANYKAHGRVVFAGPPTAAIRARINSALDGGEFFIATQVGLPPLRDQFPSHYEDIDHMWHELIDIEPTGEAPTDARTIAEFAKSFTGSWDEEAGLSELQAFLDSTPPGR